MRALFSLFDEYLEQCNSGRTLPLVINTQGWVKGLGLLMLLDLIRYACLSGVYKCIRAGVRAHVEANVCCANRLMAQRSGA